MVAATVLSPRGCACSASQARSGNGRPAKSSALSLRLG